MAQTEEMKRLLKKDEKSPSGYRPVGFEWHREYGFGRGDMIIVHTTKIGEENFYCGANIIVYPDKYIKHDSFELGIKVGDEWWFENDRGDCEDGGLFTLAYSEYTHSWGILFDGGHGKRHGLYDEPTSTNYHIDIAKRIGNIHDNPELLKNE